MRVVAPHVCPCCGSNRFEIWFSFTEPFGEALECGQCGAMLTADLQRVIEAPGSWTPSADRQATDSGYNESEEGGSGSGSGSGLRRKKVIKRVIKVKKGGRTEETVSEVLLGADEGSAPPAAAATLAAAAAASGEAASGWQALLDEFGESIAFRQNRYVVCLTSPKKRFFTVMTHDLTDSFAMPERCVRSGGEDPDDTLTVEADTPEVAVHIRFPVSSTAGDASKGKGAKRDSKPVHFHLDQEAATIVLGMSNFSFFEEFVRLNSDHLTDLLE